MKLTEPHFQNPEAARELIESIRWPNGPTCGHCGETERRYTTKRHGRWRCGNPECRKDFTVTTGTVMESSHIPLNKWLMGFYLMSASKKGMSAHQLMRMLSLGSYRTAWFMAHRIREAMRAGGLVPPMGGEGGVVEADESYYGKADLPRVSPQRKGRPFTKRGKFKNNRPIVSLVERGGNVRSFHVPVADKTAINRIVKENIARETRLHTDESRLYSDAKAHFADHHTVQHSTGEYVRHTNAVMFPDGEPYVVHTNSAEGFFSIFKRGMRGIYGFCAEKHLHRYLAEYDFRYNHRVKLGFNDTDRTFAAVRGAEGKRLLYRQPRFA